MENTKIAELEQRIQNLEELFKNIHFDAAQNVTMSNCPIGTLSISNCDDVDFASCPIGGLSACNFDDISFNSCKIENVNHDN